MLQKPIHNTIMKDSCAGCREHIELDEDRYNSRGNWCEKCMTKVNTKVQSVHYRLDGKNV